MVEVQASVGAITKENREITLRTEDVRRLASELNGPLLRPGDGGYEEARQVWNGMIDRRPALIARCENDADVVATVNFAREHELLLAVRGGGHNVAGNAVCDGGVVIDLSAMNGVQVDAEARTVRARGGATWADLDSATQEFGLATPGGVVSMTGIAGLTLGGGIGWLRRKHGLTCDNLISADVVTADGRLVRASESQNVDLFWGLKGGGGNFGVVTSFEYRLHPLGPEVMFVFVLHDGRRMAEALRFYRDYCASAPDEVTSFAICGDVPHEEPFPTEIHGEPYVLFAACYAGPVEAGRRIMQPLRAFGEPLIDFSAPMPYVEVQKILDEDYPEGARYYWKSVFLDSLDDEVIAHIVEQDKRRPSPISTVDVWHMGGAVKRVDASESAFGGRKAPYLLGVEANWEDPAQDEANISWARQAVADMAEFSGGVEYLNFPGFLEGGEETMRDTFGPKYARLVELKKKYDPTNLFRLNQNIKPPAE